MPLSQQQIDTYFEDGYLCLRRLIDEQALQSYNARFLDLVRGEGSIPEGMKIMQDVMVAKGAVQPQSPLHGVNKLFCLEEDPILFGFARHPALVDAAVSLLGKDLYSLTSNVFNKPPGVDGRHPLHQDLRYFKLSPADQIVGVWTAMLPATRENGCLSLIPGSHKGGLLEHRNPDWAYVNRGFYGIADADRQARIHMEMQPGDTLLFHPLLVHGSGRNRSDRFRRAISVHYAAGSCVSERGDWHHNPLTRHVPTSSPS